MGHELTARQLAFEYLRRLSEELSPADYLVRLRQLESEFDTLLSGINTEQTLRTFEKLGR